MAAWAKSVTSIIQYLSLVVDHEEKLSASLAVCFEDLDSAIEPGKGFHEAELSRAIFQSISQAQTNVNRERMQWASMIKEQLIPILSELLVQIKRKAADTEREWVGLDYSLMQDMDTWSRLSGSVRKALVGKQWGEGAGGQPSSQDPWLANQGFITSLSAAQACIIML